MSLTTWLQKSNSLSNKICNDTELINKVLAATIMISNCFTKGNIVYTCGCGGSLAGHLSSELMNRFTPRRDFPIASVDLSANTCLVTAIANDYGFENIYSKQLWGLGQEGDLLVAISTSGRTEAVLRAVHTAKELGMKVVLVTGENDMKYDVDIHLCFPTAETGLVQQAWLDILHGICSELEDGLVWKGRREMGL